MTLVLTRGREGVKNLDDLSDVICALPLINKVSLHLQASDPG